MTDDLCSPNSGILCRVRLGAYVPRTANESKDLLRSNILAPAAERLSDTRYMLGAPRTTRSFRLESCDLSLDTSSASPRGALSKETFVSHLIRKAFNIPRMI